MEYRPRDERVEEDATPVSSGFASSELQRLFEESSFGSPQAQQAYTPPPPHLVTDIVHQVHTVLAVDIACSFKTAQVIDSQYQHRAVRRALEEHSHGDVSDSLPVGSCRARQIIRPISDYILDVGALDDDPTGVPDRDAPPLRFNSWRQPDNRRVDAITARLGQQAYELAQDYLAVGNLDRAAHWLTVASEHDIPGAQALRADIATVQDALRDEDTTTQFEHPADIPFKAPTVIVDQVRQAADLLRRAREKAQAIVDEAHSTAEEITAEARREATTHRKENLTAYLDELMITSGSDDTVRHWDPATWVLLCASTPKVLPPLPAPLWGDGLPGRLTVADAERVVDLMKKLNECRHTCSPRQGAGKHAVRRAARRLDELLQARLLHEDEVWKAMARHDDGVRQEHIRDLLMKLSPDGPSLVAPRLWTPPSPHGVRDDDRAPAPDGEHVPERAQPEREQIVAGPKFRQALDELTQLAATGS